MNVCSKRVGGWTGSSHTIHCYNPPNTGPTNTQPIEPYSTSMGVGKLLAVEGVKGAIMVQNEQCQVHCPEYPHSILAVMGTKEK